jgi:hypothetical protein
MALFSPSKRDIYDVRAILAFRKLPNELILIILDHARYWVEFEHSRTQYMVLMDEEFSLDYSAAHPYYEMPPFPLRDADGEVPKIREVEFLVVSHGKLEVSLVVHVTHTPTTVYRSGLDNGKYKRNLPDLLLVRSIHPPSKNIRWKHGCRR